MSTGNTRNIAKLVLLSVTLGICGSGINCGAWAMETKDVPAAKASEPKQASSPKSDDMLHEIFALASKPQTRENMDRIFTLEKEGQEALEKNDLSKALLKFQEMYTQTKEVKYGDGEGRALERMAWVYLQKGEKSRAKSLAENAMEVLAQSADKKSAGRARVTAAQVYLALDNPLWALQELDMAMKDFSAGGMADAEESARAMILAATLALKINSPVEAVKFYRGAAIHYGQAGNAPKEVLLRNTVVSLLLEMGLNTAALEESKKAVQTARTIKEPGLVAAALTEEAAAFYALGEYANARQAIDEVIALKLEKQPPAAIALVDQIHGLTLAALGDNTRGLASLEKSWATFKAGGPAHIRAINLNALGNLHSLTGKTTTGIEELRQALEAQSVVTPKNAQYEIIISQNLACAMARAGESRQARHELENALRSMSKMQETDEHLLGEIYSAGGEVCWQLKEIAQADAYLRKSIETASKINDDATLWRSYTNLAKLQLAMGQPAGESLASAASHFRSPQAGNFPNAERNQFPSTREELAAELISMLISQGQTEQALITAEQLKEEAFILEWQKQGGEVKPQDREMYNDLTLERTHLHAYERGTTPDKLLKKWQDWMRRLQLMAAENRELSRLVSPVPLNLQGLVDKTHETQSTIINYLCLPRQTFIFTIDRSGRIAAARVDVGRDALQAQVAAVISAQAKSGEEARATEKRLLQALYNELLPEPVARLLPPNPEQAVVFVPDGPLYNLPFAALVDTRGKYLVESHTLTTAQGVVSILDNGPKFGLGDSLVMTSNQDHPTSETSEITSLFEPDQVVRAGKNTNLSQFAEEARSKAVLHFAAPLALAEGSIVKSALPLATGDQGRQATPGSLFKLSLPSDLAVWSGTSVSGKESGPTKVFTRGLAYAGVRNILLSLWVNPDGDRTTELVEFYKGRREGLSQAQSLRKAQLISISRDPAIRTWAAFQLVGPGR